jgi:serine protease Do
MSRRFTLVTVALTAVISLLVGLIMAGEFSRPSILAGDTERTPRPARLVSGAAPAAGLVNFADVVERINPAVVNIEATTRTSAENSRRRGRSNTPGRPDLGAPPDGQGLEPPRRGSGSGFIIDADGSILTNHHVVERAERIVVKLADGRSLRAQVVGVDPETDIALIKVALSEGQRLPVAPLGDSTTLRTGEWVCAIGNPLGYEHSVTVGVVSYLGRKLFDPSLDDYIQTDAAISFGNSGGPLINSRGEVIGINAAISSRANSIGFAVPINVARAILPQLRTEGRVSRGYIGVYLREIDSDVRQSLGLAADRGGLVQDVAPGSPGDRAGLRAYDIITSIEGREVASDEELIQAISSRAPGTTVRLGLLRDGRAETLSVKLAERLASTLAGNMVQTPRSPDAAIAPRADQGFLGLTVRDLDAIAFNSLDLPKDIRGVVIMRVEPMSASFDADLRRNTVILEINRKAITSTADYRRLTGAVRAGDVLALYVYLPDLQQRKLVTVRVEDR